MRLKFNGPNRKNEHHDIKSQNKERWSHWFNPSNVLKVGAAVGISALTIFGCNPPQPNHLDASPTNPSDSSPVESRSQGNKNSYFMWYFTHWKHKMLDTTRGYQKTVPNVINLVKTMDSKQPQDWPVKGMLRVWAKALDGGENYAIDLYHILNSINRSPEIARIDRIPQSLINGGKKLIRRCLYHKNEDVRIDAAFALAEDGYNKRIYKIALEYPNSYHSLHLLSILFNQDDTPSNVVSGIISKFEYYLNHPKYKQREDAARVLGREKFTEDPEKRSLWASILKGALSSHYLDTRINASVILFDKGYADRELILNLGEILGDPSIDDDSCSFSREYHQEPFKYLEDFLEVDSKSELKSAANLALRKGLSSKNPRMSSSSSAIALAAKGADDEEVVRVLRKSLRSRDSVSVYFGDRLFDAHAAALTLVDLHKVDRGVVSVLGDMFSFYDFDNSPVDLARKTFSRLIKDGGLNKSLAIWGLKKVLSDSKRDVISRWLSANILITEGVADEFAVRESIAIMAEYGRPEHIRVLFGQFIWSSCCTDRRTRIQSKNL